MKSGLEPEKVLRKKIIRESLYKKEYLKAKMKIATDFYDKKNPKKDFNYICLSTILIDSVPKKDETYYLQVF